MVVFVSRFTPGLENGKGVKFNKGEVVLYSLMNGNEVNITIDSELMQNNGHLGYESIFHDDGEKYFAVSERIIGWEGKR